MTLNKLLAILLTIFSLISALKSSMGLYSYGIAFLFPQENQYIGETCLVSCAILIIHFLKIATFISISYYGASDILNIKRKHVSNTWLYIAIFAFGLFILEIFAWSMPLRPTEGLVPSTFSTSFIEIITNPEILKAQIFQLLTYASFFGLFSLFKRKESYE